MIVLLANDDGIGSEGLTTLRRILAKRSDCELWVVAPDGERSGMSHYISLKNPIRSRKLDERVYEISGSPADCVITAVLGIMPKRPDIVVSGINHGPNLGTDITYSGTAAVARQAAYMGIAGVAVSLDAFEGPWHFEYLAQFVADNLESFIKLADGHHFLNINGPNNPQAGSFVEITHPCYRSYNDRLVRYESPQGDDYWFLKGTLIDTSDQEGSDWNAVVRGCISVSPVHLHPLNNLVDADYQKATFKKVEAGKITLA